jgi:hypothetical protein
LPTIWPGWPVLLAALAGGFVVAAFFRRRVRAGYEAIADRYLRG